VASGVLEVCVRKGSARRAAAEALLPELQRYTTEAAICAPGVPTGVIDGWHIAGGFLIPIPRDVAADAAGHRLKLLSGAVMLALDLVPLLRPGWLL
jgi:hypothetical protein